MSIFLFGHWLVHALAERQVSGYFGFFTFKEDISSLGSGTENDIYGPIVLTTKFLSLTEIFYRCLLRRAFQGFFIFLNVDWTYRINHQDNI